MFTIDKVAITDYEAPAARELVDTGRSQQLVDAGSAQQGTMYYRLKGDSTWKNGVSSITGTEPGTYVVEYYIKGDANHLDLGSKDEPLGSVEVTIASAYTSSAISDGSIWIIIAVAVVIIGAVSVIIVKKKKNAKG